MGAVCAQRYLREVTQGSAQAAGLLQIPVQLGLFVQLRTAYV